LQVLIFGGSGRIGSAAAWDMVGDREVELIGIVGRNQASLASTSRWLGSDRVLCLLPEEADLALSSFDVAVIALPDRRSSYRAVEACISAGVDSVDVLEEYHRRPDLHEKEGLQSPAGLDLNEYGEDLHRRALQAGVCLLDGMGFAPGLSNAAIGQAIRQMDRADEAVARVGGIPDRASAARHPLGYMVTWSFGHVLREYSVPVTVIRGGVLEEVKATSGREVFRFDRCGHDEDLECAITPGMPSFLHTRPGLRDFCEKTIRWPGHWAAVDMLRSCGLLEAKPVLIGGQPVVPREALAAIMEPRLRPLPDDRDVCVMWNTVCGMIDGRPVRADQYMWAEGGDGLSAMARVTGSSAAIGARLLARGAIQERGIAAPEDALAGRAYQEYMEELRQRSIVVEEAWCGR